MGEFGLNLLVTVELQVGILQNFVLVIVVSKETAWTTGTALLMQISASTFLLR